MKPACAICGRLTVPAAYIGAEPIGPTCARLAGLLKKQGGRVRLAQDPNGQIDFTFTPPAGPPPPPPPTQLDLFTNEDAPHG
jgi:hypothetical protein